MATFRYQLLPTPWPAHNSVRNREFTDLAGQNKIQAEEISPMSQLTGLLE